MNRRLNTSRVRHGFADAVKRVALGGERIVLHRNGKEVAALIPIEDLRLLESMEDEMELKAARRARREKGTISWEKLKAELGL